MALPRLLHARAEPDVREDQEAAVDDEEDEDEVDQVRLRGLDRAGEGVQALVRPEGLEEPQAHLIVFHKILFKNKIVMLHTWSCFSRKLSS